MMMSKCCTTTAFFPETGPIFFVVVVDSWWWRWSRKRRRRRREERRRYYQQQHQRRGSFATMRCRRAEGQRDRKRRTLRRGRGTSVGPRFARRRTRRCACGGLGHNHRNAESGATSERRGRRHRKGDTVVYCAVCAGEELSADGGWVPLTVNYGTVFSCWKIFRQDLKSATGR